MVKSTLPPPPPKPPECILECGFCRYRDKESQYKHNCWTAIICAISMIAIPVAIIFSDVLF